MEAQSYSVRAMPAQGHDRRWCARRPFTRDAIEVRVVDEPKPHITKDGKVVAYSYELTPSELEELRNDPHIALSLMGSGDADPLELNAAKARIHELEAKVVEARKEAQGEVEDLKAARLMTLKQLEEASGKVMQLEQQLASAQARLEERRTAKKG
jgi:hypothetical protein